MLLPPSFYHLDSPGSRQCRLLLQIVSARNVPVRGVEEGAAPISPVPAIRQQQRKQQNPGGLSDLDGVGSPIVDDDDFEVLPLGCLGPPHRVVTFARTAKCVHNTWTNFFTFQNIHMF